MKKLLTTALLGLSSVALISVDAKAATPAIGDLILGFRVTDNSGQGNTQNLEVDLGNMSQFTSLAPGQTLTLNATAPGTAGLALADLTSIYGANWNTRTDLAWGLMAATGRTGASGVSGFPLRELWATDAELPSGTHPFPLTAHGSNPQAAASAAYENLVVVNPGDPAGLAQSGIGTANSTNSANETAATPGSWTSSEFNTVANAEFNFFPGTPLDAFTYGG